MENPLIKFENDRYALEVQISHENGYAGFTSYIGEKLYTAPLAPNKWDAAYFTVRKGAEHTIEGVRHDLELQVVHVPHVNTAEEDLSEGEASQETHRRLAGAETESADAGGDGVDGTGGLYELKKYNEFDSAIISLLFSVKAYDEATDLEKETINQFWQDLYLNEKDPTVESVYFGKLMEMAGMNERWIYKGSMTFPPCNQFVFWNIINRVLPVSQEIVDQVAAKLAVTGIKTDGTNGNYRVT